MSPYCITQLYNFVHFLFVITWLYSDDLHWIESARQGGYVMWFTHCTFEIDWYIVIGVLSIPDLDLQYKLCWWIDLMYFKCWLTPLFQKA